MPDTPIHQWTNGGEYVLLLKCVNKDGTSYGGFVWPESGPVTPEKWSREATCESGGLFGWVWGQYIGEGKDIIPGGRWLVFRARPENVIAVGDKAKAVPGDDGELPEVIFCGGIAEAVAVVNPGWMAWVFENARGQAAASGERGQAAASGASGQAAASGWRGQAAASGWRGQAAASGERGQAAASGASGQAAASGWRGQAAASGIGGMAMSDHIALAGPEGALHIRWHDGTRFRHAFGVVGEDGIEAGVWYEVRDGKLVPVEGGEAE